MQSDQPLQMFREWFDAAILSKVSEPNAMALATAHDNEPSLRMINMSSFSEEGFVWMTNTTSLKSRQIEENPRAALCFWWKELAR
jgi:pyridoxamine 5'-phosphate oxidase